MSARCPICRGTVSTARRCRATRECRDRDDRLLEMDRVSHSRAWASAVRRRLRDMTPEQREGIRAWVEMLADAPKGGERECLRALDEVRP